MEERQILLGGKDSPSVLGSCHGQSSAGLQWPDSSPVMQNPPWGSHPSCMPPWLACVPDFQVLDIQTFRSPAR